MNQSSKQRLGFLIDVAYFATIVLIAYLCLKYVISWVLPFVLAFLIVSVIHPLIRKITKWLHLRQSVASVVVMLLIYILVGVLIFMLCLQIILLAQYLIDFLPQYYNDIILPSFNRAWDSLRAFTVRLPEGWQTEMENMQGELLKAAGDLVLSLSQKGLSSGIPSSVVSFFIAFLFTIMLSFFISMQYQKVTHFFKNQLPDKARSILRDLQSIIKNTILRYCRAALTLMLITFVELAIGLLFLRTKNAIGIAAGIAIFDALPFFGTGAIMIPWCIVELIQGNYPYALGLGILYAVVTLIRNIIEPKVVGDKLGLNPIVSLTSIYLGFKLMGVLGMIAMPIITQIVLELHKKGQIRLFREEKPDQP